MSGIDDLRQNKGGPLRVEIGGDQTPKKHTIVPNNAREKYLQEHEDQRVSTMQREQSPVMVDTTGAAMSNRQRVVANIGDMNLPKSEAETAGVDIRENYIHDILEGEDSLLEKYISQKTEEAKQWMEEKALEEEIESANEEEQKETKDEDGEEFFVGTESYHQQDLEDTIEEDPNSFDLQEEDFGPFSEDEDTTDEEDEESVEEYKEKVDTKDSVQETTVEEVETQPIATENEVEEDTSVSIDESELDLEMKEVNSGLSLDVQEEEEEATQETDEQESINHLRELAIERLKPISKRLDISSFTVAKKPVHNLSNLLAETTVKAAKWVLPNQECIVLMKEFLGSELESMRSNSEDNRNLSMLFRKYRAIYDHIASKKPFTYEAWLRSTPFADVDHYMFAVYISSFKGANYLPADCQEKNCGESFLTNDIPILDMVKFKDENAKKKFIGLYQSENETNGKGLYVSEIIPLSDRIAIGFKEPSIYGYFESISIDDKFRAKYSSIIDLIPYIDSLYIIDGTSLIPVGYKIYVDNVNKSIRSKIATYAKVLSTLTVDEFTPVRSYIAEIMNRGNDISYIYPSVTCPKCGKATREIPASAEELVFIRYQLGALANTSLK